MSRIKLRSIFSVFIFVNQTDLFGNRNKLVWSDHAPIGMTPAIECFQTEYLGVTAHLGLVI